MLVDEVDKAVEIVPVKAFKNAGSSATSSMATFSTRWMHISLVMSRRASYGSPSSSSVAVDVAVDVVPPPVIMPFPDGIGSAVFALVIFPGDTGHVYNIAIGCVVLAPDDNVRPTYASNVATPTAASRTAAIDHRGRRCRILLLLLLLLVLLLLLLSTLSVSSPGLLCSPRLFLLPPPLLLLRSLPLPPILLLPYESNDSDANRPVSSSIAPYILVGW